MKLLSRKPIIFLYVSCFLGLVGIGINYYYYVKADGFLVRKISSNLSFNSSWHIDYSDAERDELRSILNQPFHYLSKGAQSYVFLSEDQKYVIKFFKTCYYVLPWWNRYFQLPLTRDVQKMNAMIKMNAKLNRDFISHHIAFTELKEETGLVFLHLNKSHDLNQEITLFDKTGFRHRLNLDQMEFLVQKSAKLFYPSIEHCVQERGIDAAKKMISSLITLLRARCMKGVVDKDPNIETNFGVIGHQPVQIDTGRFKKNDSEKNPEVYQPELIRITDHFKQWLQSNYPELVIHLQEEVQHVL